MNHKNGDKADNRLDNLEWSSVAENERHSRRVLGKACFGENHKCAKVTEVDVRNIRRQYAEQVTITKLSRRFGIGRTQIRRIITGVKWSHVR